METVAPAQSGIVSDLVAGYTLGQLWAALAAKAAQESAVGVLDSPGAVVPLLAAYAGRRKEYFLALYLDAAHRLIKLEEISVGTLTASLVHPREVFAPALTLPAAALIVAHNHPTGDPTPSREDRETTRRLADAGRLLGVPMLDHLIVATRGYFSFRERGLLDG